MYVWVSISKNHNKTHTQQRLLSFKHEKRNVSHYCSMMKYDWKPIFNAKQKYSRNIKQDGLAFMNGNL